MINEITVKGFMGITNIFTVPNVTFLDGILKWDKFKFWHPLGDKIHETKYKYFDVEGDEYKIEQHEEIGFSFYIAATADGLVLTEVYDGDTVAINVPGDQGAHIITGYVPSIESGDEINIDVWQVAHFAGWIQKMKEMRKDA